MPPSCDRQGVPVVGVPKTIDNDLNATDYTFGFDTAVNIVMEAIDRLHTTAESHHRALIVEVMGRHAGWIALHGGIAGGANVILVPEVPFDMDRVVEYVEHRFESHFAPIIVVAEGATPKEGTMALQTGELDAFGHVRARRHRCRSSRVRSRSAPARRRAPPCSATSSVAAPRRPRIGGWRRGSDSTPSTRSHEGDYGKMVSLRGTDIVRVPLAEATTELKVVTPELYAEAEVLFG